MKQILYIEDDIKIATQVQEIFAGPASEIRVSIATCREQALARLAEQPWDLVITDYSMPGLNGMEVFQRVKQLLPAPLVILLTGFGTEELEQSVRAEGVFRYLTKPFPLPMFKNLIQQALNLPSVSAGRDSPAGALPDPGPL